MIWRAALLALIFAVLQFSWQAVRPTVIGRLLIEDVTVRPAVAVVNVLTPAVSARAVGPTIRGTGGSLRIINGCDGTEALFLLTAAFLVAPLSWRYRIRGLLLGVPVVFVVNELRILALFYANRADRSLFELMHGTVTPIAVILLIAGYFYACLVAHPRSAAPG